MVGSGAREHALAWKCAASPLVDAVYCAPGNTGTAGLGINWPVAATDLVRIVGLARSENVGLVVIGPESAVANATANALSDAGIPVFGPSREAGRLESSKAFAKTIMTEAGVPTAEHREFTDPKAAIAYLESCSGVPVVKAEGLAEGKGVFVCATKEEARAAITDVLTSGRLGAAGSRVLLEDRLVGQEVSVFALSDGERVMTLAPAVDYKRLYEGDLGPNTGGMGAYCPAPWLSAEQLDEIERRVLLPVIKRMRERGHPYQGVLYAGMMITDQGPMVLEFNCRFGDPEAQVLLSQLADDLLPLMLGCANGRLDHERRPKWRDGVSVGVVLAAPGYPDRPRLGGPVAGLGLMPEGVLVFHGGLRFDRKLGPVTAGGRVMTIVGRGSSLGEARELALEGARRISFDGKLWRSDVGALEVER